MTETQVDYEGIDFPSFTHLPRKDRDFVIYMLIRIYILKVRFKGGSREL
jgi:hypothetical protein